MAYALPALPLAALGLPLFVFVPTVYAETLGLPVAGIGVTLFLVRLFDALSDPMSGILADSIRPRFGRRRLLFALSLPITALAAWLLYAPPAGAGLVYLGLSAAMLSLGLTLSTLSYTAWGAELVSDYHGRTRLAALREGFTLAGIVLAILLPFLGGATGTPQLAPLGLLAIARVPEPVRHDHAEVPLAAALAGMRRNRPFLRLLAAFFLNGLANGIPATLFLFFVSARLGLPDQRGPLLLAYFAAGIAGVPLAALAGRQLGKHRAWCLAMIAAILIFSATPFLDSGAFYGFGLVCIGTGLLLGFDLALPPAIQADVIDVDTLESGVQKSGLYFAAWGFATKAALALGSALAFAALSLAGFDARPAAENGDAALQVLALTYAALPILFKAAAILLMWNFPLGEAEQAALRARIEAASGR